MDHDFWHDKWEKNQLGFHQPDGNPLLVQHFPQLKIKKGATVFVPLCGKTGDIAWLLDQDYAVKGCELSEIAIQQLFDDLEVTPDISQSHNLKIYRAPNLEIFVGDFFELDRDLLGGVDVIYDRAALVALPSDMRTRYSQHLMTLSNRAPMFVITFEYDQSKADGPPFSISEAEMQSHYDAAYHLSPLTTIVLEEGLKGLHPASETVWQLQPR